MDTLVKAIGKVALNFSGLEMMLSCFVARLISDDSRVGTIITCEMSFQHLLKAFDSLIRYRVGNSRQLDRAEDLVKRLNAGEQERNKVIHSAYLFWESQSQYIRLKATAKQGKGLRFAQDNSPAADLNRIIKEQAYLATELASLYKNLYGDEMPKYG